MMKVLFLLLLHLLGTVCGAVDKEELLYKDLFDKYEGKTKPPNNIC